MSTERQIEANRLNAQKSTGPRSVEGKTRVSMNALKSGIDSQSIHIYWESWPALEAVFREYHEFHQPVTPHERALVDTLARNEWLLRRFTRIEHEVFDTQLEELKAKGRLALKDSWGQVYPLVDKVLTRLQHRINSAERNFNAALRNLERVQTARRAAEAEVEAESQAAPEHAPARAPEPPQQPVEAKLASPQIGFVPEIPANPAPAARQTVPTPYGLGAGSGAPLMKLSMSRRSLSDSAGAGSLSDRASFSILPPSCAK